MTATDNVTTDLATAAADFFSQLDLSVKARPAKSKALSAEAQAKKEAAEQKRREREARDLNIVNAYIAGMTEPKALSERYGIDASTVWNVLKKAADRGEIDFTPKQRGPRAAQVRVESANFHLFSGVTGKAADDITPEDVEAFIVNAMKQAFQAT